MNQKLLEKLKVLLGRGELEQEEFDQLTAGSESEEEEENSSTEDSKAPTEEKAEKTATEDSETPQETLEDAQPVTEEGSENQEEGETSTDEGVPSPEPTPEGEPEPEAEVEPAPEPEDHSKDLAEFMDKLDGLTARLDALEDAFSKFQVPDNSEPGQGYPNGDGANDEYKDSTEYIAQMKKKMGFRD